MPCRKGRSFGLLAGHDVSVGVESEPDRGVWVSRIPPPNIFNEVLGREVQPDGSRALWFKGPPPTFLGRWTTLDVARDRLLPL